MKKTKIIKNISMIFCLILTAFIIIINFNDKPSADILDKWAASKDDIIKSNTKSGEKYVIFSPADKTDYENKIMNYIIALDKELKKEMKLLRIKTEPEKDFLLVKEKLYCLKEDYRTIARPKLDSVIKELSAKYGQATQQKDANIETYTLSDKDTKVLILAQVKSSGVSCIIYYYPSRLFKMLITDL
jgi:hypothetical protein